MLCGYPPFYGENREEIKSRVMKSKLEFDGKIYPPHYLIIKLIDEIWENISDEAKLLIR
jgi:hypothetical protein